MKPITRTNQQRRPRRHYEGDRGCWGHGILQTSRYLYEAQPRTRCLLRSKKNFCRSGRRRARMAGSAELGALAWIIEKDGRQERAKGKKWPLGFFLLSRFFFFSLLGWKLGVRSIIYLSHWREQIRETIGENAILKRLLGDLGRGCISRAKKGFTFVRTNPP